MFFSVYLLFFFPPHNALISVDEINHSNLSTHVLHISIFSSSCLLRNSTSFVIASKSPHSLLYLSNLSSVSFCNTKTQKHLLSYASPYSKSNSRIHKLILRIHNSSVNRYLTPLNFIPSSF